MQARAPGKLVLSGAYAVLEGAPAVVTAVDRYALADGSRRAAHAAPEVRAAFGEEPAPHCDLSELFDGTKKLGLGASSAGLVASLAVRHLSARGRASGPLAEAVFAVALAAHARAQGGGSGVDVAAAAFGGTLIFTRAPPLPELEPVTLPSELVIEVYFSGRSASTPELVGRVQALKAQDHSRYSARLAAQADAAVAAAEALRAGSAEGFVRALDRQAAALAALGEAAGVAIIDPAARALAARAREAGATALPAGAGGGDVLFYAGLFPSNAAFRDAAAEHGMTPLAVALGARGVHAVEPPGASELG